MAARRLPTDPETGEVVIDVAGPTIVPAERRSAVDILKWLAPAVGLASAIYASGMARGWRGYALGVGVGLAASLAVAALLEPRRAAPTSAAPTGGDAREP